MEVLCACDDRYLPHTATMLCSLLENNYVSRVHLLHCGPIDELSELEYLVASYGSELIHYDVPVKDFPHFRVDKYVSATTYYRILAPYILPAEIDRIIYLDSDLIVRRSLKELWNTNLNGYAVAAVAEPDDVRAEPLGLPTGAKYFNAGVLVMNLEYWRKNNITERVLSFIRAHPDKLIFWDQDALNSILIELWIELPSYWNNYLVWGRFIPDRNPAIIHFVGPV